MPFRLKLCAARVASVALVSFLPTATLSQDTLWRACTADERRFTCVVDGDTLWYQGTKIRLIGIDAPEVSGKCRRERQFAARATDHLTALLNSGLRRIAYDGEDRYGRALAQLWVPQGEVGPAMIAAGLAVPFGTGAPPRWCRR